MIDFLKKQLFTVHQNGKQQVSEVFKYIGPGIIVTVGFIDPGNWAANLAAGASYGYELLWVVTLSTIMLILLQHNVAHLGIVRGQCLSECAYEFLPRYASRFVLSTAGIAAAATALAEFIGAAIALKMLFGIPILIGSILTALICNMAGLVMVSISQSLVVLLIGVFGAGIGYILVLQALTAWMKNLYPEEQRGQFEGIKQIFFVCVPMIIGPAIATQVINRMGVEMEVSGTVGMVPGPSLFLVSAVLTLFTLIPLAAAGKMNRQRLQGQIR